jgi:hypothetical protein
MKNSIFGVLTFFSVGILIKSQQIVFNDKLLRR